jgi:hypothetical protein
MARHPRTLKAKGHPGFLGLQAVGCNHFPDSNHGKQTEVSGTRHRGKGCQRDLAALTHNLTYCRSVALTQAEEGQNEHDHHNQPDQINDLVHGASNSPVRLVCDVWVDRQYSQNGSTVKLAT